MNKINFYNKAENVEINYNHRKTDLNGERDLNGVNEINFYFLKFILIL